MVFWAGIDPSKWEAVFDSFVQADPSTTRTYVTLVPIFSPLCCVVDFSRVGHCYEIFVVPVTWSDDSDMLTLYDLVLQVWRNRAWTLYSSLIGMCFWFFTCFDFHVGVLLACSCCAIHLFSFREMDENTE